MAGEPTSQTTPLPLAPPDAQKSTAVKNPISLIIELVIIFYMFLVTLYFKMLRVFLPKSKKSVNGKVVLVMNFLCTRFKGRKNGVVVGRGSTTIFDVSVLYTFRPFAHHNVLRSRSEFTRVSLTVYN